MTPQKRGLFVTIQEEEWPPPAKSILGWWANCLLGITSKLQRICLVENYTVKTIKVYGYEVPPIANFKFPL